MTYEELKKSVSEFGVTFSDAQIDQLKLYCGLLGKWNDMINLTSITEENQVIEKHFLDSIIPAKYFDFHCKSLLDVGTGAGFPGLVLAICFPDCQVSLLDATKKKFAFLKEVVSSCKLSNVSFIEGRVEEQKNLREHFDVVTARAFAALPIIIETCVPLLKVKGTLIAMKSSKAQIEIKESKEALQKLESKIVKQAIDFLPSDGDKRINLFIEKGQKTSIKYPRAWGVILKKPL